VRREGTLDRLDRIAASRCAELYFYIRSCRKLAVYGMGEPRAYAEPPMKIIISIKWTSLGQEETVDDTGHEWLHGDQQRAASRLRAIL